MESKRKVLQKLFLSTLYLSAFTFGGGYVIVTLMKKKFVDEYHWIEENEMLDLVAIAQSSPGPIAVNGAIVVGYKLAGMIGVLVSIIGTIIPPFLVISVISVCYQAFRDNFFVSQMLEGMQAGVGVVIASVTYEMGAGVVKAEKQSAMIEILEPLFTEEEKQIYKRGRNAKSYTKAKNASTIDYRRATGFEAVMGYLYLKGDYKRMIDLIRAGLGLSLIHI